MCYGQCKFQGMDGECSSVLRKNSEAIRRKFKHSICFIGGFEIESEKEFNEHVQLIKDNPTIVKDVIAFAIEEDRKRLTTIITNKS